MKMDRQAHVLVTGGAGYIGSHVAFALIDAGYRVTVLDNLVTGNRFAVPPSARFVEGNVGDEPAVAQAFAEPIDSIIHLAGSLVVPESVSDPLKYYDNNVAASGVLLRCAVALGVKRIVFSSTAAVYGAPRVSPVSESFPTQPINPYGRSKLAVEWLLEDLARAHPISTCALRYFNVAGADPEGRTGQSTRQATHLVKVACEAAAGHRQGVSVFGTDYPTPDGTCVRDYIHVSDLATAHVAALEYLMESPNGSTTLNCGYGRGFSVLDILDAVETVSGRSLNRSVAGRRPGDPPILVSDNAELRATLNWLPRYDDLATIVGTALEWQHKLAELEEPEPVLKAV